MAEGLGVSPARYRPHRVVSRRSIRFPLKSEGAKVTSCLVLTEAVKQRV
jgi:hypothetical protein